MNWIKLKFNTDKTKKKIYNNNNFRYKPLQEVKRTLEAGEVISGFIMKSIGHGMCVAFGDNGKKVNIVHINKLHNNRWARSEYGEILLVLIIFL